MFLCFLVLLLAPLRSGAKDFSDRFEAFARLHELDVEDEDGEDDVLGALDLPSWHSGHTNKVLVNVDGFGAVGDGVADDTKAFMDAWKQACSTPKSVLLVPEGRRYLVNATRFRGPCADRIVIQIEGTIAAPDEPVNWDPKNPRTWLVFNNLTKAYFQGKGVIDGSGSKWWAASCKKNKSNPCKSAPTALTIDSSSAVRVKGITIQNGQQMNFVIGRSDSVRVIDVKVSAPEDSPNTDGIHITESTNVVLQNCKIGTGDDCISIVNASSNIKMKNIFCGPGHGISIGSLGKDNTTGIVETVVVDKAFLRGTTNGLRIKTWQGGSGYVRAVRYQDVRMEDVANPIIIDQFYCDSPKSCQNQTSGVEISQIMYRNITGTSKSQKAMKFACSDTVPCTHIVLNNINLQRSDGTVETYCNSAAGFGYGYINPSAECLSDSDKDVEIVQTSTRLEKEIQMGLGSAPLSSAPPIYKLQKNHLKLASTPLPFVQKSNVKAWNNRKQSFAECKSSRFTVKCSQVKIEDSTMDSMIDEACELVSGTELTIGDEDEDDVIQAYFCKAVKNNNATGILLLSDIFGFQDSATRDFAYRVACNGYNVLVPDLFGGDWWSKDRPQALLQEWIAEQKPERVAQAIFASAEWMKKELAGEGISKKLGVIGFCYGGGRVIDILAQDEDAYFGSGVSFYGTRIDSSAASKIKVPLLLMTGENDALCPITILEECTKRNEESKMVVFRGRGHGFVHRPQTPEEDADAEEAFLIMRNWLHDGLLVRS
ncbi:hypothetical protein C2S51_038137 [Perilla frutescens var. frutescens]|nr:hypothetical protein C2S51_038137 [Perilla frutescens var. frutescens]